MIKVLKENKPTNEIDIFDLIICLTSIARELEGSNINQKETKDIASQIVNIVQATATIADILNLDYDTAKLEKKKLKKAKTIEPVNFLPYDIIPVLRFYEIIIRINKIIDRYDDIIENISYEETKNMETDIVKIENSLSNIEATIKNKLEK